jgi:two-component system OmpR family sensor kinase
VPVENNPSSEQDELAALRAEVARLREAEKRFEREILELGDAVAARDSFIAIAGHELRNPMGAILLAVTNIARAAPPPGEELPEWVAPRIAALERQARAFVRRATTLLDVTRIASGNLRLDPELVDLSTLTGAVLELYGPQMERARSALTSAVEESVCGWWDRVALDQIVHNLVSNAVKYGAGKPIHVALTSDGARATLRVADRGIGISEADCARIFGRFERAVTHRAQGGFGLGLWISQQLVEALGGRIGVESEPGVGSIFTVELPLGVESPSR